MTDLFESRTHVAITLDQLGAVDHRPIVGCWPSLLVATSTASLQLDPAAVLSCEEANKLLVTPEEAADALGVGRSTIYDLLRLKILPSVKLGRARRIPVAALREWVNKLSAGDAA